MSSLNAARAIGIAPQGSLEPAKTQTWSCWMETSRSPTVVVGRWPTRMQPKDNKMKVDETHLSREIHDSAAVLSQLLEQERPAIQRLADVVKQRHIDYAAPIAALPATTPVDMPSTCSAPTTAW